MNWGLLHCRWILYQLNYQGSTTNLFSKFLLMSRFFQPLLSSHVALSENERAENQNSLSPFRGRCWGSLPLGTRLAGSSPASHPFRHQSPLLTSPFLPCLTSPWPLLLGSDIFLRPLALPQVVLLIITPLKRIAKLPASLMGVILALIHRCARALLGGFSAPNDPGPGHTIPSDQGCSTTLCFLKVWNAESLPTTTFLTKQNS